MYSLPVRRARRSAKRSGQRDIVLSPAICKSVPVVTQSGIFKETSFPCSTAAARSRPPIHTHTQVGKWDMIIAFPPCTYLSNAGAARLYKDVHDGEFQMINVERLKKGILGREFFMRFFYADCPKIAIENPMPSSIYNLPRASQIIQPSEFGHPYQKKTMLWLKGLPPLFPTDIIVGDLTSWVSGGSKKKDGSPRENCGMTFRDSLTKSKTFPGIAKAMADQWG